MCFGLMFFLCVVLCADLYMYLCVLVPCYSMIWESRDINEFSVY